MRQPASLAPIAGSLALPLAAGAAAIRAYAHPLAKPSINGMLDGLRGEYELRIRDLHAYVNTVAVYGHPRGKVFAANEIDVEGTYAAHADRHRYSCAAYRYPYGFRPRYGS